MNNVVGIILLVAVAAVVVAISVYQPNFLSDKNTFLNGFVDQDLLNILGVIVAITTASASSVHLELRRLESEHRFKDGFENTRREVKRGAYALLALFLAALVLIVSKPLLATNEHIEALVNGTAILILVWNILVLATLLQLAFKVGPIIFDDED